jgi:membrane associated rhomboid family serine protease
VIEGAPWVIVARGRRRGEIEERAFVLGALGLPCRIEHIGDAALLAVPEAFAARALRELSEYERERSTAPPREALPPVPPSALPSAVVYALVLVSVHLFAAGDAFGLAWWDRGLGDAGLIRDGEWWRALTSLTLHTDLQHLAGNLLFGATFGVLFAQLVGSGVAWSSALAAGFLGNLANAWFQGEGHRSVGASTAVFGVLGCLVAFEWRRRAFYRVSLVRRLSPLVMGVVLLAWLGTGGTGAGGTGADPGTDVGAHAFGMLWGGLLGGLIGAGLALRRTVLPWPPRVQVAAGAAALLALAGGWALALR